MTERKTEIPESRRMELPAVDVKADRVLLKLEEVRHSRRNFEVRFFFDSPDADATTPIADNAHYAGSFYMYGHGLPGDDSVGEAAVLEGYVPEAGKELEPFETVVDVTKALPVLTEGAPVPITLVVIGEKGEPIPHSTFKFDRARFVGGH